MQLTAAFMTRREWFLLAALLLCAVLGGNAARQVRRLSGWARLASPCLVLCAGSDGYMALEEQALLLTPCLVASFDCTINITTTHPRHLFFPYCINSGDSDRNNSQLLTWAQALNMAGHDRVDALKVGSGFTRTHAFEMLWSLLSVGHLPELVALATNQAIGQSLSKPANMTWQLTSNMVLPFTQMAELGYRIVSASKPGANPKEQETWTLLQRTSTKAGAGGPLHAESTHNSGSVIVLAAYYQCYKRPKAVREVLRRFQLYHPEAPIFMANDAGDKSLEALAIEYGANYTYVDTHIGNGKSTWLRSADATIAWVQRIIDAAAFADWLILLEDDVHLHKQISIENLHFDVNSICIGGKLSKEMLEVVGRIRGYNATDSRYGGFGGSILRGSILRLLDRQGSWRQHIPTMVATYHGKPIPSDQVLTSLLYTVGASVGPNPGYAFKFESDYKDRLKAGSIEISHFVKDFYD